MDEDEEKCLEMNHIRGGMSTPKSTCTTSSFREADFKGSEVTAHALWPHHKHRVFGAGEKDLGGIDGVRLGEMFKVFFFDALIATRQNAEKLRPSSCVKHAAVNYDADLAVFNKQRPYLKQSKALADEARQGNKESQRKLDQLKAVGRDCHKLAAASYWMGLHDSMDTDVRLHCMPASNRNDEELLPKTRESAAFMSRFSLLQRQGWVGLPMHAPA
ncbi:hypothetical protein B0T19DRAFT_398770 [Cercophora scortea]|uniref:Uncharacterized protein n=1 Tax=Cercophora scortea TaxID=314031 RepID=A0AAE0IXK8_9PEZI|nr:hypothetical protein B0T19DRAFT_398770 [Cercophora scortea]